jgi:BlaI family transcriptional regulator, penicillinase repressor
MVEKPGSGLSRRERQIMDIIYAQGSATAVDVVRSLPDPPSKTAVRTLLRILEEKGHLKHVERGREFVYQPTQPRLRAGRSAFRRVLHTFFGGSLEKAVAAHLADSAGNLSTEELKRLAELIHQARSKGK